MNWTTPNQIIKTAADHAIILRQFRPGNPINHSTLVLPPQAGHGGEIADWPVKGRSLARCLLEHTDGGVYIVDWKSCPWERRKENYSDLVQQVATAITEVVKPVNLIGLCQGGTLATIYTALNPEDVAHLVPVGCPIDVRAAASDLDLALKLPLSWYKTVYAMQSG